MDTNLNLHVFAIGETGEYFVATTDAEAFAMYCEHTGNPENDTVDLVNQLDDDYVFDLVLEEGETISLPCREHVKTSGLGYFASEYA